MKKCPNCGQIFSDDNVFCVSDGATLTPHIDGSAGYISSDAPTQVLQRTASQPVPNGSSTKWLYLVIGVLATALAAFVVVTFVMGGKEEKTESNVAGSKTEYKNVTPENSAQAKTSVPVNIPAAPGNVPVQTNPGLTPGGRWTGDWSSPSGAYLTLKVNLNDDGAGNMQGQIEWTLRQTRRPEKMSKIGMTAIEYVRGRYDPLTKNLTMSGYRKDDPNNVLVMVDDYRLALSDDNQHLNGAARNGGKWDGKTRLQRE